MDYTSDWSAQMFAHLNRPANYYANSLQNIKFYLIHIFFCSGLIKYNLIIATTILNALTSFFKKMVQYNVYLFLISFYNLKNKLWWKDELAQFSTVVGKD